MSHASSASREAGYYQAIEEFFVSRRGDPLTLSNADWLLIRTWRQAHLPLRVVLRGIQDALDGHAHSFSRARKVGSLRYCAAEVDAARERWERALALGQEEAEDLPGLLARLATSLEQGALAFEPSRGLLVRATAARLRARSGQPGRAGDLEAFLQGEEAALVGSCREDLGETAVRAVEGEVDGELAPYRERMPARVLAQIREDSLARLLLACRGLPRLSLVDP